MVMSYNGWPASRYPSAIGINSNWEPIPGHKFPAGIKSGDVEVVMTYVVRQLDARAEPIEEYAPGDEWGYFYKPSANSPNLISCHASGTAFDYNATQHPNGVRGTWTRAQVAVIREIQDEVDGVVYWGGDRNTADEMHFEIQGTAYQVRAVADKIRAGQTPTEPEPEPEKEEGPMYRIYWFKGEPTASGTQGATTAAYRVLCAKAEKRPGGQDPFIAVSAWHIKDQDELKIWQDRGLATMNTREDAASLRSSIEYFNGPFDNTKTP